MKSFSALSPIISSLSRRHLIAALAASSCLPALAQFLSQPAVLDAVNATGGLLILGIGINLLEIGRIHVGNLLPALLYAIVGALLFP